MGLNFLLSILQIVDSVLSQLFFLCLIKELAPHWRVFIWQLKNYWHSVCCWRLKKLFEKECPNWKTVKMVASSRDIVALFKRCFRIATILECSSGNGLIQWTAHSFLSHSSHGRMQGKTDTKNLQHTCGTENKLLLAEMDSSVETEEHWESRVGVLQCDWLANIEHAGIKISPPPHSFRDSRGNYHRPRAYSSLLNAPMGYTEEAWWECSVAKVLKGHTESPWGPHPTPGLEVAH